MEDPPPVRIATPDASLDELSFTATDPEALADWVSGLPLADTLRTATQLKMATEELALLKIDYRGRLALLEAVRPTLEYICTRLDASWKFASNSMNWRWRNWSRRAAR